MRCGKCGSPEVADVVSCEICGKAYARCSRCGGAAGARRSLKSHRGLYHPSGGGGYPWELSGGEAGMGRK